MLKMIMIEIVIMMIVKIIVVTHSSKYSAIASIVMQSKIDRSIVDAVSLCTIAKHFIIMRTILYVWDRERVCVFYSFFLILFPLALPPRPYAWFYLTLIVCRLAYVGQINAFVLYEIYPACQSKSIKWTLCVSKNQSLSNFTIDRLYSGLNIRRSQLSTLVEVIFCWIWNVFFGVIKSMKFRVF